jgi:transcriptional regulator with XRE-family HTH domain
VAREEAGGVDDFGVVLRRVLPERGAGMRELARLVSCDHALISRLLSGRQPPSAGIAQRIDDVLRAGGELVAAAGGAGWQSAARSGMSGLALASAVSEATAGDLAGSAAVPWFGDPAGRTMAVLDRWGVARGEGAPGVVVLTARQVGAEELGALEVTAEVFRAWGLSCCRPIRIGN